jgi:hypothetical protein
LVVALLRRRLLAWLIDLSVALGGVAAIVLSVAVLGKTGVLGRLGKSRPGGAAGKRIRERFAGRDAATVGAVLGSTRVQLGMQVFGLTMGVLTRNWRGPGFRLLGLRRVDVRSGGPVGVRTAVARGIVENGRKALLDRIFAPVKRRADARRSELAPELARLRREHRGDRETLKSATTQFYREHDVKPLSSCAWALPRLLATYAADVPGLCGSRRQRLADRLAGTAVVIDR